MQNCHCKVKRVAPRKRPTIPRLEFTAAVLSVKVSMSLREEMDVPISDEYFWTDSQVVLAYISNEIKRCQLFVANRTNFIRKNSQIQQWKYVPSKQNPGDDTTRLKLSMSPKDERWINGPSFLYLSSKVWPKQPDELILCNDDKELKKIKCNFTSTTPDHVISTLELLTSKWYRMKRIVATILNWRYKLKKTKLSKQLITVQDPQRAENAIIKLVQRRAFEEEVTISQDSSNQSVKKGSPLIKLSPFSDENGLLRVGGPIRNADVPFEIKHPIILPRRCITTNLIIQHLHEKLHHAGRNSTLNVFE